MIDRAEGIKGEANCLGVVLGQASPVDPEGALSNQILLSEKGGIIGYNDPKFCRLATKASSFCFVFHRRTYFFPG